MPRLAKNFAKAVNAMSDATTYQDSEIAQRNAHFLREQGYPGPHKRKRVAADWGVSESLARTWLEGKMPASRHMTRMIARWGAAYVAFVFEPCGRWARELGTIERMNRVAAEADAIKREIEELKKAS